MERTRRVLDGRAQEIRGVRLSADARVANLPREMETIRQWGQRQESLAMSHVELPRHSAVRESDLRAECRQADVAKKQLEELLEIERMKKDL